MSSAHDAAVPLAPLSRGDAHRQRLRTILFTDLVGHTEMMQRLGDDRGRDVLREHERITRDLLKQHGGAEVKTMGDGFMASFASVTKAMDCAIALQRAFAAHTDSMPEPLHVRVGLNAGEPIEEDGDLFGSTVIMASRIAAKAGAGEILIPEPLRHLLTGKSLRLRRPRRDDAQGLRRRRPPLRSAVARVSTDPEIRYCTGRRWRRVPVASKASGRMTRHPWHTPVFPLRPSRGLLDEHTARGTHSKEASVTAADFALLSIEDAAKLIASKQLSPVDLTQEMLARIEKLNAALNAYMTVTADAALAEASAAETEIAAGKYRGALHGIPIAHKDLFDTKGVRTTAGMKIFADRVPDADAAVVEKLRDAGAVSLGKLGMHEAAYGMTSDNIHFGAVRNPWDTARIPGGSSGGSAAATAAGLAFATTGSDTGGSIRCPAAFCGIVGLMPTYGRVSLRGAVPLSWTMDHAGPLTRTVRDAAIMLQAIAGIRSPRPGEHRPPGAGLPRRH